MFKNVMCGVWLSFMFVGYQGCSSDRVVEDRLAQYVSKDTRPSLDKKIVVWAFQQALAEAADSYRDHSPTVPLRSLQPSNFVPRDDDKDPFDDSSVQPK